MSTGALERMVRRGGAASSTEEHCDLCAAALHDGHRHALDEHREEVMCVCQGCALLFEREAAGRGHYRLVPDRRVRLDGDPARKLGVPVGLAFFVLEGDGTVMAHYPSPVGATRWEIEDGSWREAIRCCPPLGELRPGVEALLVNTVRGANQSWIVPIDDCHRLVAIIKREWKGLSGGRTVWKEIEGFFDQLVSRQRRRNGSNTGR